MTKRCIKFGAFGVVLATLFLFAGCGDDDSPTTPGSGENEFPIVQSIAVTPANAIFVGDTITLTPVATDPNGDVLRYTWSKNAGTFNPVEAVGSSIKWTVPAVAGVYQVTVFADDANGGTAQKQIDLKVIGGNQSGITIDVVGGLRVNGVGGTGDLGFVDKGDQITLVWDGVSTIDVNATQPTISHYAPDGSNTSLGTAPEFGWAPELPQPAGARYSLVGRIDSKNTWFRFTQSGNTFTAVAPARGRLLLTINEQESLLVDNTGYWRLLFSNTH